MFHQPEDWPKYNSSDIEGIPGVFSKWYGPAKLLGLVLSLELTFQGQLEFGT